MSPRIRVGISELQVARAPQVLVTYGLGSCLGITLYDPVEKLGGLAHTLLPEARPAHAESRQSKYVDRAITLMLDDLLKQGASHQRLSAKIFGGANMFELHRNSGGSIGMRNIEAARRVLAELEIPLVGEDVGGRHGRTVTLDLETGSVEVRSVRHHENSKIL